MASTQHNWQRWAVPLLMGLNLVFLGVMLWQQLKPQKGPRLGPKRALEIKTFLVKELDLNDAQVAEYEALIEEHQQQNRANHQRLRRLMDQQLSMVGQENNEAELDQIAQEIGNIHARLIRENSAHFNSLREILDETQKQKFKGLLKEVIGKMGPHMGPGGRRRPPPKH